MPHSRKALLNHSRAPINNLKNLANCLENLFEHGNRIIRTKQYPINSAATINSVNLFNFWQLFIPILLFFKREFLCFFIFGLWENFEICVKWSFGIL